jgi:hypothetical protein
MGTLFRRLLALVVIWGVSIYSLVRCARCWAIDNDLEYALGPKGRPRGSPQEIAQARHAADLWGNLSLSFFWLGVVVLGWRLFQWFRKHRQMHRHGFEVIQR